MQLNIEEITNEKGEVVESESLADGKLVYKMTVRDTGDKEYPHSFSISVISRLCPETLYETVRDITVNEQYAKELFERIVLGSVTPVTMYEVIEDFLAEKY